MRQSGSNHSMICEQSYWSLFSFGLPLFSPRPSVIIPAYSGGGRGYSSSAPMKVAKRYVISGRVQGVGFRYFAERWAIQLGISGYVKNCWGGNVEVYAIADTISLEEFKSHLAEGPRSARVTN